MSHSPDFRKSTLKTIRHLENSPILTVSENSKIQEIKTMIENENVIIDKDKIKTEIHQLANNVSERLEDGNKSESLLEIIRKILVCLIKGRDHMRNLIGPEILNETNDLFVQVFVHGEEMNNQILYAIKKRASDLIEEMRSLIIQDVSKSESTIKNQQCA